MPAHSTAAITYYKWLFIFYCCDLAYATWTPNQLHHWIQKKSLIRDAFIRVQLLIRVHFEKYGFFPISCVQIFALYKGQKLPQAWYKGTDFWRFHALRVVIISSNHLFNAFPVQKLGFHYNPFTLTVVMPNYPSAFVYLVSSSLIDF